MYYYQFDIDKWIKRTHYLLPEEEGIYLRLLNYYYDTEKPLPLDLRTVCRRLRLEAYWDQMQMIVSEFFEETPEGWKNSKCDRNIAYVNERAARNKVNGQKGGRPRKNNNPEKSETKPKQNPEETQSVISGKANGNPDESQTKGTDDNSDTDDTLILGSEENSEPSKGSAKRSNGRFKPPTPDEVQTYLAERNITSFDGETFCDFYIARGWELSNGKKMKDWKAAVRTWHNRRSGEQQQVSYGKGGI